MDEITASQPGLEDDAPQVHARPCVYCGAPLESGDRFCGACGGEQPVAAVVVPEVPLQKRFQCKNCGARVAVDQDQRSYACAFCDSTYVVQFTPEESGRQTPEFVIGFSVTKEQALEKFRAWLADNAWFRPGDLKQARIAEKLEGVYLPFWSFSMLAQSDWSAQIGEYWWRTETYTTTENGKTVTKTRQVRETEWWNLQGKHHRYYSSYLVSGSRGLAQQQADRIKPFHLAALRRYEPYFLAGWLSEEYSVDRDESLARCQEEFSRREEQNVALHLPGDTQSGLAVATRFDEVNSDLILLPIHMLSYRHGEKLYRFLVNGQTGKVAGDKPLCWSRISLAAAAAALAAVFLVLLLILFC